MKALLALLFLLTVVSSQSVTITSFFPLNGAEDVDTKTKIIFQFSGPVLLSNGTINIKNEFSEITAVKVNDKNSVELTNSTTVTLTLTSSLVYNTHYTVYFDYAVKSGVDGSNVILAENTYTFLTVAKNYGPMLIGIGAGMLTMLVLIIITFYILKYIIKKKSEKGTLPKVNQK